MKLIKYVPFLILVFGCIICIHFQLPAWLFCLYIIVISLISFTIMQSNNFNAIHLPLPIPENGYEKIKNDLLMAGSTLSKDKFEIIDEFYIDGIPKVFTNVYLDFSKRSFLSIYHFGAALSYELESNFDNDYTLTTSNNINIGIFPRPPKKFLVVTDKLEISDVIKTHEESLDYLTKAGLKLKDLSRDDYRIIMERDTKMLCEFRKSKPFFALRTIYWDFIRRGRMYRSPISEQHKKGIISGF